jgi:ABC-type multidrug transport system fused ATPase/permease subunit
MILEDGKIIESGTHQELLSKNKMYQELCKTELIKENKKTLN